MSSRRSCLLLPLQQVTHAGPTAAQPTNHQARFPHQNIETRFWETPNQDNNDTRTPDRVQHGDIWHGLLAHLAWLCLVTYVRGRIVHRLLRFLSPTFFARPLRDFPSSIFPAGERQDLRLHGSEPAGRARPAALDLSLRISAIHCRSLRSPVRAVSVFVCSCFPAASFPRRQLPATSLYYERWTSNTISCP